MDDETQGSSERLVVTLFEMYGAGAGTIGPRVAEALKLPFHAQAFSPEELEDAEDGQEADRTVGRVLSALGSSAALALGAAGRAVPSMQRDNYELAMENTRVVQAEARRGGVIMGRNGAFILADRPKTLHVKLDAPVQDRIRRAVEESGIDVGRAARRQKREDQLRADMSLMFYGWDPRGLGGYDIVVNTAALDLETCVRTIVAAARAKAAAPA